jgi:hypothetical protein
LNVSDAADLDVYVEHAPSFGSNRNYILNRALEHFCGAGLRYRLLERADRRNTGAVAVVHVDLTDVPPRHCPAPGTYALCLNGEATSISRVLYSRARLGPDSQYPGPVIVKSVLNSRGLPERNYLLATNRTFRLECRVLRLLGRVPHPMRCPPYGLYESVDAVPNAVWRDPHRIVERFVPGLLATPVVKYRCDFFLDVTLHTRGTYDSLLADPDTVREVTLVDGSVIPAKTTVFLAPLILHRNASVFAQPERFAPERWRDAAPTPFSYVPFGGGARRCIGEEFGWREMSVVLDELRRRFRFEVAGDGDVGISASVTLRPGGPVMLRAVARTGTDGDGRLVFGERLPPTAAGERAVAERDFQVKQ